MKFLKSYSIAAVVLTSLLINACAPDENPCPGVELTVEIDSVNLTAEVVVTGLENVDYEIYVNEVLIDSVTASDLTEQVFNVEFEPGEYTICIVAESTSCNQRIEGCIEFVIEDPNKEECLGLQFEADMINDYVYKFVADFEGIENIAYDWYVNDDLVKSEPISENRTNTLEWDFEPGEYDVCIVAESEACGEVAYCKEIVIESVCPEEVFFEWEKENDLTYYFFAEFPEMEHTSYKWLIDGDEVDEENVEGGTTDHKLIWQFDPGTYTVCMVTDQEGCDDIEYCEEIEVEAGETVECKELSYTADLDEASNTYTFTADFEGRDDVTYIWKVFINDDLLEDEVREAGSEDDHQFELEMEEGVEYEICLKQDGDCIDHQICEVFSTP